MAEDRERFSLGLPTSLHQEIKKVKGDRSVNVCIIRAIEMWVAAEKGEAVQPVEVKRGGARKRGQRVEKAEPETVEDRAAREAAPVVPKRRAPPTSSQNWGTGR
jgi:hypothetical protein